VKSSLTRTERPLDQDALVTTAPSGDPAEARELAARFGLRAEPRAGRTVQELLREANGAPVLVLASRRADLHERGQTYRATVGIAFLRLLRVEKDETDPLIEHAALKPGDSVLDATLGLGGDALVCAQVTGAPVTGLELDATVAAFTQASLRRLPRQAGEAARLIHITRADHREWLRRQPAGSFDVVLLDPMFRRAGDAAPLFELLRAHAEHSPLDAHTLREAQRVARRGVLVKDAARGEELQRLGLVPRLSRRSASIAFGWAPAAR
jgi:16S rRNA (guanine1516-N2)-methyltransferase